jgi:hypothetical protein
MPIRKFIHTFTVAASTDWQAVRASALGVDGYVLSVAFRLAAGGTNGSVTARLIDSGELLPLSTAEINAIPTEHVFLENTSALINSATVATTVNVVGSVSQSAAYLSSVLPPNTAEQAPLFAIKGDGVIAGQVTVVVRALDGCER